MASSDSWKVLTEGTDGDRSEVVLAVDFGVTGRPQAGFPELAPNLKTDCAVWEAIPPGVASAAGMGSDEYLEHWLRGIDTDGTPTIRAVLGFCVGSVYAAALAEPIARRQRDAPRVILLDPEPATSLTLYWQFHNAMEMMAALLTKEEIAAAREAGRRVVEESSDIAAQGKALIRIFEESCAEALSRAGLDEVRRREIYDVFASFIFYLIVASQIDPFPMWRTATAVTSSSPRSGLNGVRAYSPTDPGELVAKEIAFVADHIDLLRTPEVAVMVSDLLNQQHNT